MGISARIDQHLTIYNFSLIFPLGASLSGETPRVGLVRRYDQQKLQSHKKPMVPLSVL